MRKTNFGDMGHNQKKYYFEIKQGATGYLKDGRFYEIISLPSIMMCSDGAMTWGDVELIIENVLYKIRISEFVENVKTIGDLTVG